MEYPKKLIEVALPLDDINAASIREKSIRHGHPSTLHLWWARRPLAAARAVLFAQLVNDPGGKKGYGAYKGQTQKDAQKERERLFQIIRDLVKWENTNNEEVLKQAREEIRKSWRETCEMTGDDPEKMPPFLDPFAGGGSIPLEAQRLGLEAHASDLNPVAVMINKAMIEIPPKFAGRKPAGPLPEKEEQMSLTGNDWSGAKGLAEDVRRYGHWMREEAFKRIGHLYPEVDLPQEHGGGKAAVIAWLWARTVASPNPAMNGAYVPLVSSFFLSTKKGKEAWVEPVVEGNAYHFTIRTELLENPEKIKNGTKLSRGANFRCLLSGVPISPDYIKAEGKAGRMGARLMAVVAEGRRGRIYLPPTGEMERVARGAEPMWRPESPLPKNPRWFSPPDYGMPLYSDLFTPRQLVALTTFSDLVLEAREKVIQDAKAAWSPPPQPSPAGGGSEYGSPQGERTRSGCPSSTGEASNYSSPQRGEAGRGDSSQYASPPPPPQPSPAGGGSEYGSPQGERIKSGCPSSTGEASNYSSSQRGEAGRGAKWHPSPIPSQLLEAARNLRKNLTDTEQILWQCLRRKNFDGFKFRRQHPIDKYILDFYCPAAKLAIEVDGGQHNFDQEKIKDEKRSAWLKMRGICVLRFWNNDVYENLDGVLQRIWDVLHDSPPPQPSPAGGGSEYGSPQGERTRSGCPSSTGEVSNYSSSQRGEVGRGAEAAANETNKALNDGGTGATAYGDAVAVYLAFAVNKMADRGSKICSWDSSRDSTRNTFGRQAIPMTWDFAEANFFSCSTGNFNSGIDWVVNVLKNFTGLCDGIVYQQDATYNHRRQNLIFSTDPPYYDNIGYADLSDFFYVWLRRSLRDIYPDIFSTMLVPKEQELVATPYRHGSKEKAETFFMDGMTLAIHNMSTSCHSAFPVTIYYAFKQSETSKAGTSSTGWETFLSAVIKAGFSITGTWPMRTELGNRMISKNTNALASSIILVCRKRPKDAQAISRKQFLHELEETLPEALEDMIGGKEGASPIAPVDLAQAAIGPGMAVFSKYAAVLEADGSPMTVHTALILINKAIDEYFTHAESDMEGDTRFCVDWFQQYGFKDGPFGEADVLARAKGTTVDGVQNSGVIQSGKGKVRLLKINEYPSDWDPAKDFRLPIWEACHHLCRALQESEIEAGNLLAKIPEKMEPIRQLTYRLYTLCERKGWAEDARRYNELITSWYNIVKASQDVGIIRTQMSIEDI